uniref:hypothetical protein n=1 Tax=Kutzneria viridogrisea TaxID=47990 RepID=UPI0016036C22
MPSVPPQPQTRETKQQPTQQGDQRIRAHVHCDAVRQRPDHAEHRPADLARSDEERGLQVLLFTSYRVGEHRRL